jgi:hypothetical protein
MRRFKGAVGFVAMVLVVLGLSGRAEAGEGVPFKGKMEGKRVSVVPLDPPVQLATIVLTGNATPLGKYDLVITAIANPQAMMAEGTYEFVAANGDTLTADFIGIGVPTEIPGVILQLEKATITGGTGRFAGATGSFEVERLFDRNTEMAIGEFEGKIICKEK